VTSVFGGGAGRVAKDEFGVNDDFAAGGVVAAAFAKDVVKDDVADLFAGNVNGGERRRAEFGQTDVVETGDGDVAGDLQAALAEFAHDSYSHEIVDAENSSGAKAGIEQFTSGLAAAFETIRGGEDFRFCAG